MPTTQNETSIANIALTALGQNPVSSLDDNLDTATWMKANYAAKRDLVIESRMWTFATVRATSTTADKDQWSQMYSHGIPPGWLQVFRVYRDVSSSDPSCWSKSEGWRMENNKVLASDSIVYLWGVQRVEDPGKFSSLFIEALAARLAADACIALTENRTLQRDMWSLYNDKLREAATRDGQQGSNESVRSSSLISARGRY